MKREAVWQVTLPMPLSPVPQNMPLWEYSSRSPGLAAGAK